MSNQLSNLLKGNDTCLRVAVNLKKKEIIVIIHVVSNEAAANTTTVQRIEAGEKEQNSVYTGS